MGALKNVERFAGTRITISEVDTDGGNTRDVVYYLDEHDNLIRRHDPSATDGLYAKLLGGPFDGLYRIVHGAKFRAYSGTRQVEYEMATEDGKPVYRYVTAG